ncbi:hypothetical protein BKA58DRAFT_73142 [Alternaria rosae]|uniref:uncharacterized protein n=1 Tax=Alternaria rosae TaxID=1187941 RepID=UPI001E8D2559|nr:uncharacterized protein BKA58DRAFT_73142 [Alternaria rosae]KAH6848494.1 hypothetical protein BKA58DRAFT_73142 [Alternaria rosae]
MSWSKDNTISVLALLATCIPMIILMATCLLRQKRPRAKQRSQTDVEAPFVLPRLQPFHYGPVRRESALMALILVQREVQIADRGSYQAMGAF